MVACEFEQASQQIVFTEIPQHTYVRKLTSLLAPWAQCPCWGDRKRLWVFVLAPPPPQESRTWKNVPDSSKNDRKNTRNDPETTLARTWNLAL